MSLPLVALLVAGAAAAAQSPANPSAPPEGSSQPGRISHPTGSTDVVLRMDTRGGLVPLTFARVQAPEFTLYGDGTVLFRSVDDPEGDGFPPFVRAQMDGEQMDSLLLGALDEAGLRDARDSYDDQRGATDLPTTVFSIDADDVTRSVAVYGLGVAPTDGANAAAYEGFAQLAVQLVTFGDLGDTGTYHDAQPYQPMGYRAFISPAADPDLDAIPWPWPGLAPADFGPYGAQEDVRIGGLTPEQAAQVTTVPSGGVPALTVDGPDGIRYTLTVRPLLPDEPVDPTAPAVSPSPTT